MYYQLLFVTTFLGTVTGERWGLIHFSRTREELFRCMDLNGFSDFNFVKFYRGHKETIDIMKHVAESFADTTRVRAGLRSDVAYSFRSARIVLEFKLYKDNILESQLQEALIQALGNCGDDDGPSSSSILYDENHLPLPYFLDERVGVAQVLEYVLVNWPRNLRRMIESRDSRSLLIRYYRIVLPILVCCFSVNSHYIFRSVLRNSWRTRAELYFDNREKHNRYINHIFNDSFPVPYTTDDPAMFIDRFAIDAEVRDPDVSEEDADKIVYLHEPDDSIRGGQSDLFAEYQRRGMSTSDHYFEEHLDIFYRIIFFFLEMEMADIPFSADISEIPSSIIEIVYNDEAYRNYLTRRRRELKEGEETWFKKNLKKRSRVHEMDLIMVMQSIIDSRLRNTTATEPEEEKLMAVTEEAECSQDHRRSTQ